MPAYDLRRRFALVVALGMALLAVSCTRDDDGGGFAIFLLPAGVDISGRDSLAGIELPDDPLLATSDMVSYATGGHVIELTPDALERLRALDLAGSAFVVAVGREPIYRGTIMAPWFSRSDDGVVIVWPAMEPASTTIRIQLGYPGPDFFRGIDPRADRRILESLAKAQFSGHQATRPPGGTPGPGVTP